MKSSTILLLSTPVYEVNFILVVLSSSILIDFSEDYYHVNADTCF